MGAVTTAGMVFFERDRDFLVPPLFVMVEWQSHRFWGERMDEYPSWERASTLAFVGASEDTE